jgi:pimeloyl-ACP methyl ester carboxylesterase
LGGVVAQELALRLGERVSALALVCTTAGGVLDAKNPLGQPARAQEMKAAITADFRTFVRGFAPLLFKAGTASPLFPWAVGQMQKTPAHVAVACFDTFLAADLRRQLKTLKVPTVVLHGRHDAIIPLTDGAYLAEHIPGARLVTFEESGHAPFLEEPDAFNAALGEVL